MIYEVNWTVKDQLMVIKSRTVHKSSLDDFATINLELNYAAALRVPNLICSVLRRRIGLARICSRKRFMSIIVMSA